MKNKIILLLLTCALSLVSYGSPKTPALKYCLLKDTTIVNNKDTFHLYKNSLMLFSDDTTMLLFYKKDDKIDTIKFCNLPKTMRKDSIAIDSFSLINPNITIEIKRYSNDNCHHDSLFISKNNKKDTIYLYLPLASSPLLLTNDTCICIDSCQCTNSLIGLAVCMENNILIYYPPIKINKVPHVTPESPGMKLWVIIMIIVIVLLIAGGLVFFFIKKRRGKIVLSGTKQQDKAKSTTEKNTANTENSAKLDNDEINKLKKQLEEANRQVEISKQQLADAKQQSSNLKQTYEKQVSDLKKEHKENIEKEKAKKDKEFADERERLNRKIREKESEIKTIEDTVRSEMQKKINRIEDELKQKNKTLGDTQKKLTSTEDDLRDTRTRLKNEEQNVATLKAAQKQFTDKLTFTPWASDYSKKIATLFEVADKVIKSANKLMTADVSDPYLIAKAIANYEMNIGSIDIPQFTAEVFMAASKQMAFNESGIVNLTTVDEKSRPRSLRRYYIDEYLKKYINAIVVLNESLAGVHRLIPDLQESLTRPFGEYRSELNKCFSELEIKVISVKLFDKVTNNVDLKVTEIDYDTAIPADSILEISNCIVYAADADRPSEKIYVKSQK